MKHRTGLILIFCFIVIIAPAKFKFNKYTDTTTFYNTCNTVLTFYYIDSFSYGHPIIVKKGKQKIQFNSAVMLLQADSLQTPFLINSNESLTITYEDDGIKLVLNDNNIRNNELNFFKQLILETGRMRDGFRTNSYQEKVDSISQFYINELKIENIKAKRLQFLKSYTEDYPVSQKFSELAKNMIIETCLKDHVTLYFNNSTLLKGKSIYDKKIDSIINIINDADFSMTVTYMDLCNLLLGIKLGNSNSKNFQITNLSELNQAFSLITNFFQNNIKDYLVSKCIYDLTYKNVTIPPKIIEQFNKICNSDSFEASVMGRIKEQGLNNKEDYKKNRLKAFNGEFIELENILHINKGKIIVLDFWASWCLPCIKEISPLKKIQKKLINEKIIFISISIDKNEYDWKRACIQEKIIKNSYKIVNPANSPFINTHSINSIPRYIIIGKNGQLININFDIPSSPNFENQLRRLLNQTNL